MCTYNDLSLNKDVNRNCQIKHVVFPFLVTCLLLFPCFHLFPLRSTVSVMSTTIASNCWAPLEANLNSCSAWCASCTRAEPLSFYGKSRGNNSHEKKTVDDSEGLLTATLDPSELTILLSIILVVSIGILVPYDGLCRTPHIPWVGNIKIPLYNLTNQGVSCSLLNWTCLDCTFSLAAIESKEAFRCCQHGRRCFHRQDGGFGTSRGHVTLHGTTT